MKPQPARRWLLLALTVALIGLGLWIHRCYRAADEISLGDLTAQIADGEVERVTVRGDDLVVVYTDPQRKPARSRKEPGVGLSDTLRSLGLSSEQLKGVNIKVKDNLPWPAISVSLPLILIALLLVGLIYAIISARQETKEQFPTSIARGPERVQTTLDDLGGIGDAREALKPVLSWLASPRGQLGVEVPRGVLIAGPSGVGKTLLARSLAGETGRPLLVYNGAEFAELLVGMGSARMRAAFADARRHATETQPVVLFIDQVELIATDQPTAASRIYGGGSEVARTLATLLAELDNPHANRRIFVVAATSRLRLIAAPLLAPGRLSLHIKLALPDEPARKEILEKLTASLQLADEREALVADVARGTKTFSCAELAQLARWAHDAAQQRVLATGPGNGDAESAGAVITRDDFVQAKARLLPQPRHHMPAAIFAHLDRRIVGQEAAKKRLAVAVSNHYLRLREATRFDARSTEIEKANVLIIGPTGSGKTMLIEEIAAYLELPYVIYNATILTETAYTGANVEQMLSKLLAAADHHLRRAEYGIICIDEIDKLAFHQGERSRHTGAAVQQELLKLVEGTIVDVPKGDAELTSGAECHPFDTTNVLFVCLGAFNGIETVVARRLRTSTTTGRPRLELISQVQPVDIIDYGFLPELTGRFPVVTFTHRLEVEELVAILRNEENGLMRGYEHLLELRGYEPIFEREAIERIAREAVRRQVGARGLPAIMEEVLLEPMYRGAAAPRIDEPAGRERESGLTEPLVIDVAAVERALAAASAQDDDRPPTMEEVLARLGRRGHRYAKEILALTSWQHYQGHHGDGLPDDEPRRSTDSRRRRQAVLLVDPLTHQRRRLVADLAAIWRVPLAEMGAEQLERSLNAGRGSEGWLAGVVQKLLEQCDYDLARAERGILFIDDFDQALSRVTIDPSYNLLSQQIAELLRGRVPSLRTADGQVLEFDAARLFPILGGDFRFTTSLTMPFGADPSQLAKYEPERLIDGLREEFNLGPELLENLYVAPLDLEVDDKDLESIIRTQDELVRQKYRPLLALRNVPLSRAQEAAAYARLVRQARDERWPIEEIGMRLEQMLLEELSDGQGHDRA
jgi:ATP-dependent Clp protease ATP-binding subunit ClpX